MVCFFLLNCVQITVVMFSLMQEETNCYDVGFADCRSTPLRRGNFVPRPFNWSEHETK